MLQGLLFFLFFFAYYLTNLWGTLTLGHLKQCYGLSKDRFGSVSSVGYDFSLKINKRGAYLLLKGSYCFSFVSSSSRLCRFKQFWPCSWSPSLSLYVLLQHVIKYVFVWVGLLAFQMNRKRRSLLSCDWDKSQRKELGTFSLSAHLGICLFFIPFQFTFSRSTLSLSQGTKYVIFVSGVKVMKYLLLQILASLPETTALLAP